MDTKKKDTKEKKITKKPVTKKKEVKKVVKKEEKTAVPNAEPFGVRFKKFVSSYKFLYAAFGILFVVVILLACMVFVKGNEEKQKKSNIVFSIMEKNTRNYINLELAGLVGREYMLKVTNYRGNQINSDGAEYKIEVTNDTDVEIEVLKENQGENLITDQKHTIIEGDSFGKKEKEEVVYYFKVKNSDKLKDGDSIRIEVES